MKGSTLGSCLNWYAFVITFVFFTRTIQAWGMLEAQILMNSVAGALFDLAGVYEPLNQLSVYLTQAHIHLFDFSC